MFAHLLRIIARNQEYLDPGTGSFLIQILVAAFAGIAMAVGIYWRKVKKFFRKLFKKGDLVEEEEDIEDDIEEEDDEE
jgi:hypothetical protein